jgi:hypothetical protein
MSALTLWIIVSSVVLVAAGFIVGDRYDGTRYYTGCTMACIAGFALFCGSVAAGTGAIERTKCREKAEAMKVDHSWGYMKKCIVFPDPDGPGIPIDNYRGTETVSR